MNQKDVWGKYILAQEKVLENKSKPIGINTAIPVKLEGNKILVSIDQEIYKKVFKADIERVFKLENFDFSQNHILQDLTITENISLKSLSELKEDAQNNYIEFNEHPVIEGEISAINSDRQQLEKIIGVLPTNYAFKSDGLLLLTIAERSACETVDNIVFEKQAGAVFPIKPSMSYLISTFYKKLGVKQVDNNTIDVEGKLHVPIEKLFNNLFDLKLSGHKLFFELPEYQNLDKRVKELEKKGIEFPTPENNVFCFSYYANQNQTEKISEFRYISTSEKDPDVGVKIYRLKKALQKYFKDPEINFSFTTQYYYNKRKIDNGLEALSKSDNNFWDKLYTEIHCDNYQISQSKRTLSFDFNDQEELTNKLESLKSHSYIDIYDREEKHRYKYKIKFNTGLHELQSKLRKELPNLSTRLVANGERLIFKQFYKTGNKGFIRDNLNDRLNELIDRTQFIFSLRDTFQEKYICEENFDLKVEQEDEKLLKLRREEFYFGNIDEKYYLGKLQKVDYPNLEFFVDDEKLDEVRDNINSYEVKAIFPNLKGEKDKIIRLSNTIQKLESKDQLPNNNAKLFLFDSSKAKAIEDIEYLLNTTSQEWKEFEKNVFSSQLNESQKQAVYKSLHAEELALIQGPPGTGKSTAIAEIIWQHARRNQKERILLTSETNLAVDNAIDRLKNDKHNVVKPIRFGNSEKLESEGRFYSVPIIENWKNMLETEEPNTVSHWVNNISNRVKQLDNEIIDISLSLWKNHLKTPTKETRELFTEKYIEYANLIGATGSSIGKLNSEGKYTSFFHSYLNVFEHNAYTPIRNWEVCNKTNIVFDTIIMDEASKATPPELALPILYGKKAIIVGDHRQLPPMVDGNEIKDTLITIGEKDLAKTLSRTEFDKSQFQNLFENIDSSIKGTFDTQYRMHPAINDVIRQFYIEDGGLECGLPLDEEEHHSFDNPMSRYHGLTFDNVLSPETHVLWVDVDTPEIKEGTSRVNYGEIEAINNILKTIKRSDGITEFNNWLTPQTDEEKQIGIISFYGKQVNYINRMLKENHSDIPTRLSTVDRFQGMERNILIVSMVRSNKIATSQEQQPDVELYGELGYPKQSSLGFAELPNRLNVALSRARRLLVIIGNKDHFCTKEIYKNVFDTISSSERGEVIEAIELSKLLNDDE